MFDLVDIILTNVAIGEIVTILLLQSNCNRYNRLLYIDDLRENDSNITTTKTLKKLLHWENLKIHYLCLVI